MRSCCICRTSLPPVSWLCAYCWKELYHYYLPAQSLFRTQNSFRHIRLLDWNSENDFFIRTFINSLKKGAPAFVFKKLNGELLHRIIQIRALEKNTLFIPAPPSKNVKDHAFCLAQSLSYLCQRSLKTPLVNLLDPKEQQKRKNKRDRKLLNFQILEEEMSTEEKNKVHFIFVDDVLTTGATALAAWKALGKPKNFTVLTLAWKQVFESPSAV